MAKREMSRRTLLKGAAGLQLGLFTAGRGLDKLVLAKVDEHGQPTDAQATTHGLESFGIYLKIGTDDTVTILNPRPDMGQGPLTSLAMHLAEELEVDWPQVRIEQAGYNAAYGSQTSGGSTSTRSFWTPMRRAGAQAREMLISAAAARWGVPAAECRAEHGTIVHDGSGRSARYGELAEAAAALPVPDDVQLKRPSEFKIVGTPTPRVEAATLVDGSGVFGWDVKLPGMLVVAIARPRPFGGSVTSYDDTAARRVPGVRDVFRYGGGVAVAGEHTWAALAGRDALQIEWAPGPNADVDDDVVRERLRSRVGTLPEMPGEAVTVIEAEYDLPYLAHAPMEPMNCVAYVHDNRCEVWAPTQSTDGAHSSARRTAGVPAGNVTVHVTLTGGGFGRRLSTDYVREAVGLSKRLGTPVQVVWTRDDDMRHDNYRNASHHRLRGGLDARGEIVGWAHRAAIAVRSGREVSAEVLRSGEPFEPEQSAPPYSMPRPSVSSVNVGTGIPTGAWRSVQNTQYGFVNESFLDELAAAGGHDPYELRSRLLGRSRLQAVVQLAAEKADWGRTMPAGSAQGIACFSGYGSYVAHVVEASVSPAGEVRVQRVVCAVDCGIAINPLGIAAQLEGGVSDGLATALHAQITIAGGGVEQTSYGDYGWLHLHEMPEVEVHIVPSERSPGGMGEPGFPSVSPALTNAIFRATGRRLRRLPIRRSDLAGWTPGGTATPTSTSTPTATPTPTGTPADAHDEGRAYLPRVDA